MANDLYGELLARALQRRAPPGHFPAFVTPGEANLLRSQGGGVAPGGGQYMAGGIPAFSYGSEAGFGQGEGEPGDPTGFGGDMGPGQGAFGGMAGEFGSMGFDIGNLGIVSEGEHGRSVEEITRDYVLDQIERSRQKAEEEAAAAKAAAAMEQQLNQLEQTQAKQSKISQTLATPPPTITVETVKPAHTLNLDFPETHYQSPNPDWSILEPALPPPAITVETVKPAHTLNLDFSPKPDWSILEPALTPTPRPTTPGWTADYSSYLAARGLMDQEDSVPTPPSFTDTIAESETESAFEESLEQEQAPYSGDTTDQGAEQQQANLDAAFAASMNAKENPNDAAAQAAAHAAEMDLSESISQGGLGRFSPATSWGINSEIGNATFSQLQALNAQDHQGYAINNPQPSDASILASQVFAQLNPTLTNAMIGLSGFMPGTVGFTAFLAAVIEEKGLMSIPAVRAIPGIQAISDIIDIPGDLASVLIGGITDPITEPIGQALSEGQKAVADALSGITGTEESAGFDDAGEVEGGALDIEIVPPIITPEPKPAPPARTFADVDEATRNRIRDTIISGLQRTDRPTEGVTAFGPLFT